MIKKLLHKSNIGSVFFHDRASLVFLEPKTLVFLFYLPTYDVLNAHLFILQINDVHV